MAEKNETADQGGENERVRDLEAQISKLQDKNKELIAEKQVAKQKAQEAQDAADDAVQKTAERDGNMDALKAAHAKELKKLQDKLDASEGDLRTIRVDNELARSLTEQHVRPEMAEAVTALLKGKVEYASGVATIDGKSIADHVAGFMGSESGAHFRRAPDHGGSGATGSGAAATRHQFTKENFSARQGEWLLLAKSDPALAKSIAQEVGRNDLALDL